MTPPPTGRRGVWTPPLAALAAAAVVAAFAVRAAGAPGPWDTDSYRCAALALGMDMPGDPRSLRVPFLAMVGSALGDGGDPGRGCLPGCALSALAVLPLFAALLRTSGPRSATLGAALWIAMPIDLDECSKISSDVPTSLAASTALWAMVRASDSSRPLRWMAAAGVFLGLGAAMKETLVLGAVGFAAAAAWTGRGARDRAARFAAVGACAAGAMLAVVALTSPERIAAVSSHADAAPWAVRWGDEGYARRLVVDIPATLLTATGAYGSLFLAALPLLGRLPFRAARGDVVAAAACGSVAAFVLVPIGLSAWPLLPAEPRFLLWCVPPLVAAVASVAAEDADSPELAGAERWTSLALVAPAFLASRDLAVQSVTVAAAVCAAVPAVAPRRRSASAAAALCVLLAAATAWPRVAADSSLVAAAGFGLALLGAAVAPRVPSAAPLLALLGAAAGTALSAQPDARWRIPRQDGVVLCDGFAAQHLRLVWRDQAPGDPFVPTPGGDAAAAADPRFVVAVSMTDRPLRAAIESDPSWTRAGDYGEFRLFRRER